MITGSGLIANSLKKMFANDESLIVFARGVSNSACSDATEYEREFEMISEFLEKYQDKLFIYFSTTSIFDSEKQATTYVKYKLQFEEFIKNNFQKSIVLRLPIIVGRNNNQHQLFGYLLNAIKQNGIIGVHKNAGRYLLDIDDLPEILQKIIDYYKSNLKNGNMTINVCSDNAMPIMQIIEMLSKTLKKQPVISFENKGVAYKVDNSLIKKIVGNQLNNKDFQMVFDNYFS
jgi:UDP-2-acetamido-2,6-beta-L-arabino-hexul-4-ose reductase